MIWIGDDAGYHTSKTIAEYCRCLGLIRMDWPAEFPDLNPIKNL